MAIVADSIITQVKDILILPPNPLGGEDKIIGDLHGNLPCLRAVLETLDTRDRLFITGDLIDRGQQSADIIPAILSFQYNHPSQLYAVKGNHEVLCAHAILSLEALVASLIEDTYWNVDVEEDQSSIDAWIYDFMNQDMTVLENLYPEANVHDLRVYILNGGAWLVYLFRKELEQKLIDIDENGNVSYADQSSLMQIKKFIESLPYIIRVVGSASFNIVHADMPLGDLELSAKCADHDFVLTDEQREYAIWAREHDGILFRDNGRDKHSTRTFTGHSIIAFGAASVIRATNTINLDVATFKTNVCFVVNHNAGTCEFVGSGNDQIHKYPFLQSAYQQLSLYLKTPSEQNPSSLDHLCVDDVKSPFAFGRPPKQHNQENGSDS